LGGVFGRLSGLTSDATWQLMQFSGGLDAFAAKTKTYVDLYYSDVEKAGISATSIRKQLADAGINADTLSTTAEFRALVDSTDINTEQGRKQLAALLDVAGSFADVAKVLAEAGGNLGSIAGAAPLDSQVVGLLTEPAQASALAAQQSAASLSTANEQLSTISSSGAETVAQLQALVRVQQAGNLALIERLDAAVAALAESSRPAQLAELAR